MYKSFDDVIFIPFSASSQNLKMLDKKEKKFRKVNILLTKRAF